MRDFNFKYKGHSVNIKETLDNDFIIKIDGEYYSNIETGGKMRLAKRAARKKIEIMYPRKTINKKVYFTSQKGFRVLEHDDLSFAKYEVSGSNQCFDCLNTAILYAIGLDNGAATNSNQLMTYVEVFQTMTKK